MYPAVPYCWAPRRVVTHPLAVAVSQLKASSFAFFGSPEALGLRKPPLVELVHVMLVVALLVHPLLL